MYQYGSGVKKNINEAVKWYTKSSDMGHPTAQLSLGNLYLLGEGVEKNIAKGLELINKAAEQNYPDALNRLGVLYYRGENVSIDFRKALDYTKKAVEYDNDNITAIENLAYYYENGVGTDKDYKIAKDYYLKAIKTDSTHTDNYISIGIMHLIGGYGLPQSDAEFIRYCELAEKAGNLTAKQTLGNYYTNKGSKVYKEGNYYLARYYFNLAVSKGNTTAENNIRIMNAKGQ
jgi:TPR repeat protein